jgi:hypothetical protein
MVYKWKKKLILLFIFRFYSSKASYSGLLGFDWLSDKSIPYVGGPWTWRDMFLWNIGAICLHTFENVSPSDSSENHIIKRLLYFTFWEPYLPYRRSNWTHKTFLSYGCLLNIHSGMFQTEPTYLIQLHNHKHHGRSLNFPTASIYMFETSWLCGSLFGHLYICLDAVRFTLNSMEHWKSNPHSNKSVQILTMMDPTASPNTTSIKGFEVK